MKLTAKQKQFRNKYQKHLAKMTHAFLLQALDQDEAKVKVTYQSFCDEWVRIVEKVNTQYGAFVLAHESWRNIWERDGYRNIVTKPIAPEEKAAILRVIFIVEGKTEQQRQRREAHYKFMFILIRIKIWWNKLPIWKANKMEAKKVKHDITATAEAMTVVK